MSVCDAIAYINHDIDDAVRAGLITMRDLPADAIARLGETTSERINTMVVGLIEGSREDSVGIVPEVLDALNALRDYLYTRVYPSEPIHREIAKAKRILGELYRYLLEHPDEVSGENNTDDSAERRVVDFIAGMTDQYALHLYERIFFPDSRTA